jgi:hypothetical protein
MFIFTIGDVIGFGVFAVFLSLAIVVWISKLISQWKCKHGSGVHETRACNALCNKCGKDLGFIGTWREKNKGSN